jgi:hypothetical protein
MRDFVTPDRREIERLKAEIERLGDQRADLALMVERLRAALRQISRLRWIDQGTFAKKIARDALRRSK